LVWLPIHTHTHTHTRTRGTHAVSTYIAPQGAMADPPPGTVIRHGQHGPTLSHVWFGPPRQILLSPHHPTLGWTRQSPDAWNFHMNFTGPIASFPHMVFHCTSFSWLAMVSSPNVASSSYPPVDLRAPRGSSSLPCSAPSVTPHQLMRTSLKLVSDIAPKAEYVAHLHMWYSCPRQWWSPSQARYE
jgi:hypothetical protein